MNYYDHAQELSNSSVVDIFVIDELAEVFDYDDPVTLKDIANLSRLIESFVLSNEVVIRDSEVVISKYDFYNFDYGFTEKWIKEFSRNNVIKYDYKSASSILVNEFSAFDKRINKIITDLNVWSEDPVYESYSEKENIESNWSDSNYFFYEQRESNYTWNMMTSFYGLPFLTCDFEKSEYSAKKVTNISLDMYHKIENYYDKYFEEISKYLGHTYFRIPFILGMVLKECNTIEDIPQATMHIRDKFIKFNMEATELEYQLRTTKNIFEQVKILQKIERAYENIANRYDTSKRRIQSRIFDVVQSLDLKSMTSKVIEDIREMKVEENGLLLIPGYYDLWKVTEDVEQTLPQLKRLFGKRLDDSFYDALLKHQIVIK